MWQGLFGLEGFMWEGKPVLFGASEENTSLDEELKKKKIEVQKLKGELDFEIERGKRMQGHYGDLVHEKIYLEELKYSKQQELVSEENSQKVLVREMSNLLQHMNRMKKELGAVKSRQISHENCINEQSEKCEALKSSIRLEEDALTKWIRDSAQLERDKIALIKYTHQDDSKIKELGLLLERLGKECRVNKAILDDTDTELYIAQSELDQIQSEFRRTHEERADIISNWEKVIQRLQQRNQEIDDLSDYMAEMREREVTLNNKLNEAKQMLAAEVANNRMVERKIAEQESFSSKLRTTLNEEMSREGDLNAEMETLRNASAYLGYKVQNARNEIQNIKHQLEQKENKLKANEMAQETLQKDIDSVTKETFDTDYYAKKLEKILHEENNRLKEVKQDLERIQNSVLKYVQDLGDMARKEKAVESQVKGMRVSSRSLSHTITKLDHDRIEQQKLLAQINMGIKQTEQRIKLMEGEIANEEERWEMEHEVQRLQSIYNEKKASLDFINNQVKLMMEKINISTKTLECRKKENNELTAKIDFLEYFITNSKKALEHERERKETLLVEECTAKLQLNRCQYLLQQRSTSVMDLQKNQAEFETAMKERIHELKKCKDMVQSEIHKEEEECYKVRRQVQQLYDKTEKYQTRHDIELKSLGLTESVENIQLNVFVKVEGEKRALQQERDELVSKVMHLEDELHALQNTLWIIQTTNEQFRQLLNPPGLTTEENEALRKLENEQRSLDLEVHAAISRIGDLKNTVETSEKLMKELLEKSNSLEKEVQNKQLDFEAMMREVSNLETKLVRVNRSNSKLSISAFSESDKDLTMQDIKIHVLRDLRKMIADQLFVVVSRYPSAIDYIKTLFENTQLPLPPRAKSTLFSRASVSSVPSSILMKKRKDVPSSFSSIATSSSIPSSKSDKSVLTPSVVSLGSDLSGTRNSSSLSSSSSSKK